MSHAIVKGNNHAKLRGLIEAGQFDVNQELSKGHRYQAIVGAVAYDSPDCFMVLLEANATLTHDAIEKSVEHAIKGNSVYLDAIWNHPQFVPNAGLCVCLERKTRSVEMFRKLLSHPKLVKGAIEIRVDHSVRSNQYVVTRTVETGNIVFLRELRKAGVIFSVEEALCSAVDGKKYTFINQLLEWGADVNMLQGWRNLPPIGRAAKQGNHKMLKILIEAGANTNVTYDTYLPGDTFGNTRTPCTPLLDLCVWKNGNFHFRPKYNKNSCLRCVKLLLKHGANINYTNPQELNALTLAMISINPPLVELLIKSGVEVGKDALLGFCKQTYIHYENEKRCESTDVIDIFKMLVEAGADPYVVGNNKTSNLLHASVMKFSRSKLGNFFLPVVEWYIDDLEKHWAAGEEEYGCDFLNETYFLKEKRRLISYDIEKRRAVYHKSEPLDVHQFNLMDQMILTGFQHPLALKVARLYYLPDYAEDIETNILRYNVMAYRGISLPFFVLYEFLQEQGINLSEETKHKLRDKYSAWLVYASREIERCPNTSFTNEKILPAVAQAKEFISNL